MAFCHQFSLHPLPLTDFNLCRFVSVIHDQQLSPSSIRLYLSSLRFLQISSGGQDPCLAEFPRLHYVIRAVKRQNPAYRRPSRLPITPAILRHLHAVWSVPPRSIDSYMLWAACCLGFFAFLRSGEFTCSSSSAYSSSMLSWGDIHVNSHSRPEYLVITLRHSKTDVFDSGVTLYVGATGDMLCPVAAVLAYLAMRPSSPGPLFIFEDGRPLSRVHLVAAIRQGLASAGVDVSRFSGHSFRIGAATTAAQVGIPDSLIQTLGRWKSSAFLSYIRTPIPRLTSVSRRLLS